MCGFLRFHIDYQASFLVRIGKLCNAVNVKDNLAFCKRDIFHACHIESRCSFIFFHCNKANLRDSN